MSTRRDELTAAESKRLAALRGTGLLDSAPDSDFDGVADLAAHLLGAPVALVSLVEPHRQFFKAALGVPDGLAPGRQTPASHSICKDVVASGAPVVLPDTRADEVYCHHPAVPHFGIGAYLGVPLRDPAGEVLGALCVIDPAPRAWTEADVDVLTRLSAVLTGLVEKVITARRLEEEERGHATARSLTEYYLDTLDEVFFVADGEGHLVRWNRAAETATGHGPEALVGRSVLGFFAEGDRDDVAAAVAETLFGGRGRVEAALLTPSGPRPFEFTAVRLPGGGAFCGIGRDLTERRAAERAVRESEERFRLLAETATDVILTVDESMTVRYVNAAVEPVLGYDPFELIGAPISVIVPEQVRAETAPCSAEGGGAEAPYRRKDGSEVLLAVNFGGFTVGGETYLTGIMRDVTAQRAAERAVRASERRFRSFMETVSQVVFGADAEGHIVPWGSEKWTALTGQTPEEAEGWGWADVLHPDDAPRVMAEWAAHVATQTPYGGEYRVRLRDGDYHQFHVVVVPVFDEDGTLIEWMGTGTDVDAARRAERGQAEANERLRLALEAAGMGKWELNLDRNETVWSMQTRQLFGVEDSAPVSQDLFYGMVHEEDRERVQQAMADVTLGLAPSLDVEYRLLRTDGEVRWFRSTGRAFHDALGAPVRIVGTVLDVTDQKAYESGLIAARAAAEAARAAAEEATRLKASVLANMSHEIRTPLTGVIGYADLLAETITGEDAEFVSAIQRGAHRLLHTLNSVLELSQMEAGDHGLHPESIDVRGAVVEACALLLPQARAGGLALQTDVPEEPVLARADERALSRVVFNLVSNAVKYTEAGTVTVMARALPEGGAEVRVADTGIGIAASFLPHLFEEFRQESEGDDRRYEGAGLGLAIVRRLVDELGGEILVESEKGVGSTFTVRLPAADGPAEGAG